MKKSSKKPSKRKNTARSQVGDLMEIETSYESCYEVKFDGEIYNAMKDYEMNADITQPNKTTTTPYGFIRYGILMFYRARTPNEQESAKLYIEEGWKDLNRLGFLGNELLPLIRQGRAKYEYFVPNMIMVTHFVEEYDTVKQ